MERGRERERERQRARAVLSIHHSPQSCPAPAAGPANWSLINLMELQAFIRGEILLGSPGHKPPGDIDVWSEERGRPQCRCLKCKTRLSSFPPLIPSTALTTSHHVSLHRADLNQPPALAREIINKTVSCPLWSGGSRPGLYCLLTDQPAGVRRTCSRPDCTVK